MSIESTLPHGLHTSDLGSLYKVEYDQNLNLLDINRITTGPIASRPAFGVDKRFWFDPTTKQLSFDDGTQWIEDVTGVVEDNLLTVESASVINQDVTTDADVTFNSITAVGGIGINITPVVDYLHIVDSAIPTNNVLDSVAVFESIANNVNIRLIATPTSTNTIYSGSLSSGLNAFSIAFNKLTDDMALNSPSTISLNVVGANGSIKFQSTNNNNNLDFISSGTGNSSIFNFKEVGTTNAVSVTFTPNALGDILFAGAQVYQFVNTSGTAEVVITCVSNGQATLKFNDAGLTLINTIESTRTDFTLRSLTSINMKIDPAGSFDVSNRNLGSTWFRITPGGTVTYQSGLQPTGGAKGEGTINTFGVFDNNTQLTCYVIEAAINNKVDLNFWNKQSITLKHERANRFSTMIDENLNIDKYSSYWKNNKHLLSMPSRANWEHNEYSVGEFTCMLWETVEIQAVHIDKLNERLKKLEGE